MTDEERLICERLAKRMGATNFRTITLYPISGPREITVCDPPPGQEPNTRLFACQVTGRSAVSVYVPPDFFHDHAASAGLVRWLAGQSKSLRNRFEDILGAQVDPKGDGLDYLDVLMTDLGAIARAADAATGGNDDR